MDNNNDTDNNNKNYNNAEPFRASVSALCGPRPRPTGGTPAGQHAWPRAQQLGGARAANDGGPGWILYEGEKIDASSAMSAANGAAWRGTGPNSSVQARSLSARSQQIVHRERRSGLKAGAGGTTRVTKGNSRAQ